MPILPGVTRTHAGRQLREALSYARMPRDLRSTTAIRTVTAPLTPEILIPAALSVSAFVRSASAADATARLIDLAETYDARCRESGVIRTPYWTFPAEDGAPDARQWTITRDEIHQGFRFVSTVQEWRPGGDPLYFQDGRLRLPVDRAALAAATGLRDLRHEVAWGRPLDGLTRWHLAEWGSGLGWVRSISVYWGPQPTAESDAEFTLECPLGLMQSVVGFPRGIPDATRSQVVPFIARLCQRIVGESELADTSVDEVSDLPIELSRHRLPDEYLDQADNWFGLESSATIGTAPLLRVWGMRIFDLSDPTRIGWRVGLRLFHHATSHPTIAPTFNQLWDV